MAKKWCLYHLPLRSGDKKSPKSYWDKTQIEAFNDRVFDLIDRVKAENRSLNLWGIVFPGSVDFRRYANRNNALPSIWFDGAIFGGPASFSKCAFSGITSFDRTTFQDIATFHGATFGAGTDHLSLFSDAEFCDGAVFDRATFAGMANFVGVRFHGRAMFARTALHAALFAGARFGDETRFDEATFSGYQSSFLSARFKGLAVFRHAVFSGHASFEDVVFEGNALFNGDPTAEGRDRAAETFPATV
jgi:Pentapeptide repeats (9 copies)